MTPGEILDLSAERQLWERLIDAAWRDGYRAALGQLAEAEARGYARAIADVKAAQHALYNHLRRVRELEDGRWIVRGQQRTRKTFGRPHPNDFTGQDGAA
jgi:hypothetical protein